MRDETTKIRLWELKRTEKAILFQTMPPGDKTARQIWLPRSQIEHISHDLPLPNGVKPCTVTIPLWLSEKNEL